MSKPSWVLAERLRAQLLSGPPASTVVDVVGRLLAVQGQDPRGARLAIRARSAGLTARDVDHALTDDRSVVITTVNRGTLHLVRSEDYWWLHELTTPQLTTASERRLRQEQVSAADADRGVTAIERSLATDGPLTRNQLRDRVAAAGIRVEGQAFVHIGFLATLRGLIIRGPMIGREHAFVLVRDWLGPAPKPLSRDVALGELASRFLAGHGPATESDLAKWAGITLGDARRGLRQIVAALVDRDDGLAAVVDRADRPDHAALPPPRLLGSFDPSLHGWVSREPILGAHTTVVTRNGIFRPFAMVKGRAVATWTLTNDEVCVSPFEALASSTTKALAKEATEVRRFLGSRLRDDGNSDDIVELP